MTDLREPLDSLVRQPQTFTSHLRFPDPASIVLYDNYQRLGIAEASLIELALDLGAMEKGHV